MSHEVFISYSSIDKTTADTVCSILEQNGISCWIAPRDITPGLDFAEAIIDGIKSSKLFILVYSSNSSNSKQVIREVDRAVHTGLPIINLRLEDVPLSKQLEYYLSSVHWLDAMTLPLEEHINTLSGVVKMLLRKDDVSDDDLEKVIRDGTIRVGKGVRSIEGAGKNQLKKAAVILAVLGVILVAAMLIVLHQWKQKNSLEMAEMEKSVAVLPFDNLSGDPGQEYFSDGMMDEILDRLFKIGDLKVISRTSSMRYRNSDQPLKEIARELGVSAILEGSVRRAGNLVRITVQLIDAETDSHLWSETYDGDLSDLSRIFIVQSDVAQSVARELKAVISEKEQERVMKIPDIDPAVYDDYLKALSYSSDFTMESLTKALEILNSAIEKDPDWAPLYVGLTQVWMSLQQMGHEPPGVAAPKIFKNLNKALELDPDLAEAHSLNAMIAQLIEWDWEKSEREFLKTLAINPSDAASRIFYSQLLAVLHRNDEAAEQGKLAYNLDPVNPNMKCWYAGTLMAAGDFKTVLSLMKEVMAVDPGNEMANSVIIFAAYRTKEYDKVLRAEKYFLPLFIGEDAFKEIERIYREHGIVPAYDKIMKHLEEFAQNNPISFIEMALRYIIANQPDKAMDWIEKGFEIHDPRMIYIATKMFNFDPLFKNPRFIAICKKMNLPLPKSS